MVLGTIQMYSHSHRCIPVHEFQVVLIRDITTEPMSPDCLTAENYFIYLGMVID